MTRPWLEDARRMRAQGMLYWQIAKEVERSTAAVWNALNPERATRNRLRTYRNQVFNQRHKTGEPS